MACLENECGDCGNIEFSNTRIRYCSICGSDDMHSFFDEALDDHGEDNCLLIDEDW